MAKSKLNTIHILLIVFGAFILVGVIVCIPEMIESAKMEKEIEASVSLARANGEMDAVDESARESYAAAHDPDAQQETQSLLPDVPFDPEDTRSDVLTTVPDYIANRGIVLRGDEYRESGQSWRGTTHDDSQWCTDYVTDCNLRIEGSDEEFTDFVESLAEYVSFYGGGNGYPVNYCAMVRYEGHPEDARNTEIYRSEYIRWDCRGGQYVPSGYGVPAWLFYDPSGRYIFEMDYAYPYSEEVLLRFLEPHMTRVEVTRPGQTVPESATEGGNPEVIDSFIDAMHEFYANIRNEDPEEILAMDDVTKISFTTDTGIVHDYYFVDGRYIVHNDEVYAVRRCEALQSLLDDPYLFYIEAP